MHISPGEVSLRSSDGLESRGVSTSNLYAHGSHGGIIGCYVYMLLCRDDGPLYVKVGISAAPFRRAQTLRNSCPVTPRRFAVVGVQSRKIALAIERDLLAEFSAWASHGEWFRLDLGDKPRFNDAWRRVFRRQGTPSLPLNWTQMSMAALADRWRTARQLQQRDYARRGEPYRDFLKDAGE